MTSLTYKLQVFWSYLTGCSENQGTFLDNKEGGGRKWLMHAKVRDGKEGGSNFIKFLSACSKVRIRSFRK
jgi:hypothetical protein